MSRESRGATTLSSRSRNLLTREVDALASVLPDEATLATLFAAMDFSKFSHLTFDCYGTLIDWETGILDALMPFLERRGITASPVEVLQLYVRLEAEHESGDFKKYRDVLRGVMDGFGRHFGFKLGGEDLDCLAESIRGWRPFPDTVHALRRLQNRFRLVIVSNIDDALFSLTAAQLRVIFDEVITAEQVRSYKPFLRNFQFMLERLAVPASRVLHVAQSLYHDHVPAQKLGLATAWVNRPSRLAGTGLALPAEVKPSLEVPDLRSLADLAEEA